MGTVYRQSLKKISGFWTAQVGTTTDHRREMAACRRQHEAMPDGVLVGQPIPQMEHEPTV